MYWLLLLVKWFLTLKDLFPNQLLGLSQFTEAKLTKSHDKKAKQAKLSKSEILSEKVAGWGPDQTQYAQEAAVLESTGQSLMPKFSGQGLSSHHTSQLWKIPTLKTGK